MRSTPRSESLSLISRDNVKRFPRGGLPDYRYEAHLRVVGDTRPWNGQLETTHYSNSAYRVIGVESSPVQSHKVLALRRLAHDSNGALSRTCGEAMGLLIPATFWAVRIDQHPVPSSVQPSQPARDSSVSRLIDVKCGERRLCIAQSGDQRVFRGFCWHLHVIHQMQKMILVQHRVST